MTEYFLILVSTVLANNFVLVRFLGLCPFMGVSNKLEGAIGMSVATMFVLTLASVSSYLLSTWLLRPLGLEYLSTLGFILVIATLVQLTEMVMRKTSPLLYRILGIFLPLITTNCAVLGVALLNVQEQHNLLQSALYLLLTIPVAVPAAIIQGVFVSLVFPTTLRAIWIRGGTSTG